MNARWILVVSLLASCGAASDVGTSAAPDGIELFDTPVSSADVDVEAELETTVTTSADPEPTTSVTVEVEPTTTIDSGSTTVTNDADTTSVPSSTTTTAPPRDPNAAFCEAAVGINDLGTSVSLDDPEAAAVFFDASADRWDVAAGVAPATISVDVATVASFRSDLRDILAAADYDLFAVFEEVAELEETSGADLALIRSDQFIYADCAIEPPSPEQATAAFYGELLGSSDDRTYLAELLASAETFSLEGAMCFVEQATADAMHPLVGAPSTPAQDEALANVLSTCQLSIGT